MKKLPWLPAGIRKNPKQIGAVRHSRQCETIFIARARLFCPEFVVATSPLHSQPGQRVLRPDFDSYHSQESSHEPIVLKKGSSGTDTAALPGRLGSEERYPCSNARPATLPTNIGPRPLPSG